MANENENLDNFLAAELAKIPPSENQPKVPDNPPGESSRMVDAIHGGNGTEEKKEPGARHSIKTCPCDSCQAKRREIAIRFGLLNAEDTGEETEDLTFLDIEFVGKLLSTPHRLREITVLTKNPALAVAWKVSKETEENFGRLGHAILNKYLKRADFKYKSEIILGAYIISDLGIRAAHEKQLAILDAQMKELERQRG